MIRKKAGLIWFFLACLGLLWPATAAAQGPAGVVVIYPVAEELPDSMSLSVYFVIVDEEGRPIPQMNIDSASIQLLGGNTEPVEASVANPQTPFFVALVLDGSGSMANVMPEMREAAKDAIDSAPALARMSVIQFSDDFRPILDFTGDQERVQSAIDRVESIPNGSTCLYDALYDAMELLDDEIRNPQERRAIIAFTDGKDEKLGGGPCSFYNYDDVIARSRPANAPNTPIHTIGLCADAQCSNLNRSELRNMSLETLAFSATGDRNALRDLFREIMDGLSSQWVAQANVYSSEGQNQAALLVRLRNPDITLTAPFTFFSKRAYNKPLGPTTVQITGLTYDPAEDLYRLALSVANPQALNQVIVQVWDKKSGTQILPDNIFENPATNLSFERETTGFEPGREYSFRVRAVQKDGTLLLNDKSEPVLTEQDVTYEPELPEEIPFVIESANADFQSGILTIDLNVSDEGQIRSYEGFIVDEGNQKVSQFGPSVFEGARLQQPLPPSIRQLTEPAPYKLTLYLTTKDDQRLTTEPFEFKPNPPPPPGLMTRIIEGIKNPIIWGSILVVLLSVGGLLAYWNRPVRSDPLPPPLARPPVEHSVDQPRLRLRVLQSPNAPGPIEKAVTDFPCVIGRQGSDINLPNDPAVSRRHLEISLRGGEFFVTDLKSTYGSFIGDTPLEAGTPARLSGSTVVRLGRRTHIRLDPQ